MDQKTLKQRGIKNPDDKRMFFTLTKQNYSKHIEKKYIWKKMGEGEKAWANKVGLVTFTMRNCVHENHIALQLMFKNHSNIVVLQVHPSKCNFYATRIYK